MEHNSWSASGHNSAVSLHRTIFKIVHISQVTVLNSTETDPDPIWHIHQLNTVPSQSARQNVCFRCQLPSCLWEYYVKIIQGIGTDLDGNSSHLHSQRLFCTEMYLLVMLFVLVYLGI